MKAPDIRDEFFATLFQDFLRPLGFRKKGRTATRQLEGGLFQKVELESSTWNTAERVEFGINISVSHVAFRRDPFSDQPKPKHGDVLLRLNLRRYVDPPHQRWTWRSAPELEDEFVLAASTFREHGLIMITRMSDIGTIEELCAEHGPTRYFEARSWCLRKLGRVGESIEVIRSAIANAPHEGFKSHAARLLARNDA